MDCHVANQTADDFLGRPPSGPAYLISLEYDGHVQDERWLDHVEFGEEFNAAEREALYWRHEAGIPATIQRCGGAFTFTLKEIAE